MEQGDAGTPLGRHLPVCGLPAAGAGVPVVPYERMPPDLRDRLAPQVARLGYLGAFFGLTAHQPAALAAFVGFTEALKEALPFRLTEVVALTVASTTQNDYELSQHLRLCRSRGVDESWIAAVLGVDGRVSDPTVLAPGEHSAACLARACAAGHGGGGEFAALVADEGAEVAVAVLLLVGRYITHAVVSRALRLRSPVPALPPTRGDCGPTPR